MGKARTIRWGRAAKILTDIPKCIWQGQHNQTIGNVAQILQQSKVHRLSRIRYRAKLWHTEFGIQLENNSKKQTESSADSILTWERLWKLLSNFPVYDFIDGCSFLSPLVLNQLNRTGSQSEGPDGLQSEENMRGPGPLYRADKKEGWGQTTQIRFLPGNHCALPH